MLQGKLHFFVVACFTVPYSYIVLEFTTMQECDFSLQSLQTNEDKIKIFCRTSYLVHSRFILFILSILRFMKDVDIRRQIFLPLIELE